MSVKGEIIKNDKKVGPHAALGSRIKEAIDSTGKSQKTFAEELGVNPPHLSRWIKGVVAPSYDVLAKIGNLTGVSLDKIILNKKGGTQAPAPHPHPGSEAPPILGEEPLGRAEELILDRLRKLPSELQEQAQDDIIHLLRELLREKPPALPLPEKKHGAG